MKNLSSHEENRSTKDYAHTEEEKESIQIDANASNPSPPRSEINSTFSMGSSTVSSVKIREVLMRLIKRQQDINDGTYTQTGVGRKRENNYSTDDIKEFVKQYLRESFVDIIKNSLHVERKDLAITTTFRAMKSLPLVIHKKLGLGNKYRNKNLNDYVVAFTESFVSYMFMINKQDQCSVHRMLEYSLLKFPAAKVRKLIENVEEDCLRQNDFNDDIEPTLTNSDGLEAIFGASTSGVTYEDASTIFSQLKVDLKNRDKTTKSELRR